MLTVSGPDAVPLLGDTPSHWPPALVVTLAAKVAVPPVLASVRTCAAGTAPPCASGKAIGLVAEPGGVTVTCVFGVTVRLTGIISELLGRLAELITICPWKDPGLRPTAEIFTTRLAAVMPCVEASEI